MEHTLKRKVGSCDMEKEMRYKSDVHGIMRHHVSWDVLLFSKENITNVHRRKPGTVLGRRANLAVIVCFLTLTSTYHAIRPQKPIEREGPWILSRLLFGVITSFLGVWPPCSCKRLKGTGRAPQGGRSSPLGDKCEGLKGRGRQPDTAKQGGDPHKRIENPNRRLLEER